MKMSARVCKNSGRHLHLHMETKQKWNTKLKPGRTLAASIAAVIIFSTTVFAGVSIYRMQREPVGKYGVDVKVVKDADSQTVSKSADDTEDGTSAAIEDVRLRVGYLPKGMVQTEEGKYSFEDHLYQGGVSIVFYRMDTGDSAFDMLHGDVLSSENVTINGHEGVYLEYPNLFGDETRPALLSSALLKSPDNRSSSTHEQCPLPMHFLQVTAEYLLQSLMPHLLKHLPLQTSA